MDTAVRQSSWLAESTVSPNVGAEYARASALAQRAWSVTLCVARVNMGVPRRKQISARGTIRDDLTAIIDAVCADESNPQPGIDQIV